MTSGDGFGDDLRTEALWSNASLEISVMSLDNVEGEVVHSVRPHSAKKMTNVKLSIFMGSGVLNKSAAVRGDARNKWSGMEQ